VSTKKQRRRQQKLRRHEYEEVWVDAEGNVVEDDDDAASSNGASRAKDSAKDARKATASRATRTRAGREVQPPSWGRVTKRGLFFAPIMFFLIAVLPGGDRLSSTQKVFVALQYTLMLVLFMYLTERVTYRIWRKRQANVEPQKR
jgi:hypothetical protein